MDELIRREINILIIDHNNSPFILPLIRSFSGFKNIHLDVLTFTNKKSHPFRYSRYLRHVYFRRGDISDNFETCVKETIEHSKPHLVIPTREKISKLLSEHYHWLTNMVKVHPVPDVGTLETTSDKWELNQWLKVHKMPYSRALKVPKSGTDNVEFEEFPFPALLKPVSGAGGLGIRLINDIGEMNQVLSREEKYQNGFFIQEYILGHDIDFSLFSTDGDIHYHTIQRGMYGGSFEFPKAIEFVKNRELLELAKEIIRKLRYTGIAHLDFRYDIQKKQYILIDFNARYWNSIQGSRIMGVNFPLLVTAYTLGIPVDVSNYRNGYYYYGTSAIGRIFKNLTSRTRYPVQLRNTHIFTIAKDPLPEIIQLLRKPFRSIF